MRRRLRAQGGRNGCLAVYLAEAFSLGIVTSYRHAKALGLERPERFLSFTMQVSVDFDILLLTIFLRMYRERCMKDKPLIAHRHQSAPLDFEHDTSTFLGREETFFPRALFLLLLRIIVSAF